VFLSSQVDVVIDHEATSEVELGEKTVPITLYLTQDERVTLTTCALLQMYRQDDPRYREVDEVRRLVTRQRWQAISSLLSRKEEA